MNITQLKYYILGRKKNRKRPPGVVVYSVLIFLLPLYYYSRAAGFELERMVNWEVTFRLMPLSHYIISVCALVCFIGLFFVLRIGFFMFFIFCLSFIIFNLYLFFVSADIFNVESVLLAFFGVSAFTYFTSREHSAPYVRGRQRGWRSEVRRQMPHTVTINGMKRTILNINSRGMLVRWRNPELAMDEDVGCTISIMGDRFHIDGVVVRVVDDTVAFAFRNMDLKVRKDLYYALKRLEEEKAQGTS